MARTINFNFAQGGGSTLTVGQLILTPTHMHTTGTTVVVPGPLVVELVDGAAVIDNVEPTPTDPNGWRYEVRVETPDRMIHLWVVSVPTGTTPIAFSTLPVISATALPLDITGARIEQWMASVRTHAASADANAVAAMQLASEAGSSAASAHTRLDELAVDGLPGGGGGGGSVANGNYWNRTQTVPVITIAAGAPWPTSAPEGALIVRLTGTGG